MGLIVPAHMISCHDMTTCDS